MSEIPVLGQFLHVIRHVRAKIAAPQGQLGDGHLGVAEVKQHHALHVVDVVYPEPIELQLHDFEESPMKLLDE